jgi:RNA recognition motif-containing protein
MKIFVGNLSGEASEEDLEEVFGEFGKVISVDIARDKHSGLPRGFAFVEMHKKSEARKAIRELDLREIKGRAIVVNEARSKGGGRGGRGKRRGGRRR